MATIAMNALGVTKTVTMPDNSLTEWCEAYGIPATDIATGEAYTNEERVTMLFDALVNRMTTRVAKLRRRKTVITTDDVITVS
jgi:hypothetical protein